MIASLPMYDPPPLRDANDAFWGLIRDRLRAQGMAAPDALTRTCDLWDHWTDPGLVLSQTCGFPYRARLHGQVTLVGAPDFGVPDCPPGYYCSVFVVRRDDPRRRLSDFDGAVLAYNEALSQSGWAAPQTEARLRGLHFVTGPHTGGHALSARAVALGQAEIAALDAVTWANLQTFDPVCEALIEIDRTQPTPVLPYISAKGTDAGLIHAAIAEALAALPPDSRQRLRLRGIVAIPADRYLAVPIPPAPAQSVHVA
jgi:ABC-type phosphate/phosphonate transport system substrate-binding protein